MLKKIIDSRRKSHKKNPLSERRHEKGFFVPLNQTKTGFIYTVGRKGVQLPGT